MDVLVFLQIKVPKTTPPQLANIQKNFKKYVFDGMEEAAVKLEDLISFNAMGRVIGPITGRLGRSIKSSVTEKGLITTLTVESNMPYARIQDLGGLTGRGHRTRIRPSRYFSKEFDNDFVLRILERKLGELFR